MHKGNYFGIAKRSDGMTLIELIIVLVIIAILGMVAMAEFTNLKSSSEATSASAASSNIRGSCAIAIAQLQRAPTVAELATYVSGKNVVAKSNGIELQLGETTYLVPTYTGADCSVGTETGTVTATVACIGNAVPSP